MVLAEALLGERVFQGRRPLEVMAKVRRGAPSGCAEALIARDPALGEFVIPSLLGGSGTLMIGKVLFEEFFSNRDWPVASAVAVILLLILIIPIVLYQRNAQREMEEGQ